MMAHSGPPDTWPDPMMQLSSHLGLSKGVADVLRLLFWLPLASADDIAGILSRSAPSVLKALGRLREARLVESAQLGYTTLKDNFSSILTIAPSELARRKSLAREQTMPNRKDPEKGQHRRNVKRRESR